VLSYLFASVCESPLHDPASRGAAGRSKAPPAGEKGGRGLLGELVLLLFVVLKVDVDIVVRAGAEERGEEGEWVS
jgi:hypothetical protein